MSVQYDPTYPGTYRLRYPFAWIYRGEFSVDESYHAGDVVLHMGSYFISSKNDNMNHPPVIYDSCEDTFYYDMVNWIILYKNAAVW